VQYLEKEKLRVGIDSGIHNSYFMKVCLKICFFDDQFQFLRQSMKVTLLSFDFRAVYLFKRNQSYSKPA
jgi:hypothetical protein